MNTFKVTRSIQVKISFVWRLLSTAECCHLGHSTINSLSDDVLLCIFDSYRRDSEWRPGPCAWPWDVLVHVCQRWRRIVFAFPGYLDLHLRCKSKTDVQAMLEIWPALPLHFHIILDSIKVDENDIIGTLEHRDRMAGINFQGFKRSQLEKCMALMQEPFPVLKSLELWADEKMMFVITDTFLGGSAPLLQTIGLHGIRFPSLPTFLSSTSDLVKLDLGHISLTGEGHIPLDAMTTCLSLLTKLRSLTITVSRKTPSPYPKDQRPPTLTHTVLPSLVDLCLEGPHGYLEDLVDRIDVPLLTSGNLHFYDVPMFDTPRVPQFIHRTEMFKLVREIEVHVRRGYTYSTPGIDASFHSSIGPAKVFLSFPHAEFPAQCAIMERICAQWPPLVSHIEVLNLYDNFSPLSKWLEEVMTAPWRPFLRPFTAVQTLRLHARTGVPPHVAYMLGKLDGRSATEMLPALHTIELDCSEGNVSEALRLFRPFLLARKESECPVVALVSSRRF